MMKLIPLVLLILAGTAFSQTAEKAVPTYSVNDKLVGLSQLYVGLRDCSIRSVSGKVKDVDLDGDLAVVMIKVDKKTKEKVSVPLERVSETDRVSLFRHLITKNNMIRLSGYACNADEPFSAFSVDRVY